MLTAIISWMEGDRDPGDDRVTLPGLSFYVTWRNAGG